MKKIISLVFIVAIPLVTFFVYDRFYIVKTNMQKTQNQNTNSKTSAIKKTTILSVGDSLTAGYGLLESESYPAQLENRLVSSGLDVTVVNSGISGETTSGLLSRTDFLVSENADVYLITIGGNDALRNVPISETKKNLNQILTTLTGSVDREKIVLFRIKAPLNLGITYAKEFNDMYDEMGKKHGVNVLPFVEEEVFLNQTLMQGDGIHPNKNGYEVIVDKYILPKIKEILSK